MAGLLGGFPIPRESLGKPWQFVRCDDRRPTARRAARPAAGGPREPFSQTNCLAGWTNRVAAPVGYDPRRLERKLPTGGRELPTGAASCPLGTPRSRRMAAVRAS